MAKLIRAIICLALISLVLSQSPTTPIDAIGTVLPRFIQNGVNSYRAFNDLMKQSLPMVVYQLTSWGGIGRCWNCKLNCTNDIPHLYPSNLSRFYWAVAQIPFLAKNDDNLLNTVFNIKYQGNGTVGVQQAGLYNTTFSTSTTGNSGQFTLKSITQSLFVYIYVTDINDPVRSISITPASLGANPPTFTDTFLNYLQPFNLLRTCFWQGQNLYNSGKSLQQWKNRVRVQSTTQITDTYGVALEHILQLETITGNTLWLCIPDTADTNYITQMATLVGSIHNKNNIIYIEYGNVYTIMNDFPDKKTNPAFSTWMQTYGASYRSNVLFTINYRDVQYYINAVGMRTSYVNFTYIDAIGFQPNFGVLDIGQVWNANTDEIKSNLTHLMLNYEIVVNKAYQLAKMNGTNLITYSGGPYIKTYRYAYIWKNSSNSSYAANATIQRNLADTLNNMNLNDDWVGQFYLQWIGRLKAMGMSSIVFCDFVGGAWTLNTDIVPLVQYFNMTTPAYRAITQYVSAGRVTKLPLTGTVPPNPFICTPNCVWGDCIDNVCACYAGYSGDDCSVYTKPQGQNKIGTNLQGITYWSTQNPFVDMHRGGSAWVYFLINGGWSSGDAYKNQVPLDSNGYPTYLPPGIAVGSLMARDIQTHYDPGNYTVLYDGDGILSFGMYDVKNVIYGIGKCILTIQPSTNGNNGIFFRIDRTNPNNYIRNIRVIRPGFEQRWWSQNFSPLLLEKLAPFSTLRFMDWTNTNGQTDTDWATRVLKTHRTYTKNGVAWQQAIHLSNILGKDMWINIPHLATNDYITQLAKLVLNKLEPHLKVYVEYSNEVWGTLFPGGKYAQNQGVTYYKNVISDPTQARFCWYALITGNISDIWKSVWGADKSRVKIVASTQAVNADTTKRILACQNLWSKIDQVAIAPYFDTPLTDTMTSTQIFTQLNTKIDTISTTIKTHLAVTNSYKTPIPLSCYQAGQGLLGSTTITTTLQTGIQTDDRMRTTYIKYYEMLFNNSMVLVNHYTDSSAYSRYGSWGMFQYTDEKLTKSAKWNGTIEYLTAQNLPLYQNSFGACQANCNGNGFCSFGKCICYSDYTGPSCQIGRFVDYVQCGYLCTFNQGICVQNNMIGNNRYFSCVCNPGYIGAYCSIALCTGNCNYAGTCTAPEVCSCFRGKMGAKCQIDCGCGGHGSCYGNGTCNCDIGFVYNTTSKKCQYSCNGNPSSSCYGPNLLSCSAGCVYGTCNNGTCACWPGFTGQNCSTETTVTYPNSNLGINIGGLSYWSTQHFLKDYFKQSSQWIPQYYPGYFNGTIAYTWNTSQSFPTQPNGYPASLNNNQSVAKLLLRDLQLRYPNIDTTNQYVLLYDGDGVLKLGFDAKPYEYSVGRIRFTVVPSIVRDNGVYVQLLKTNPANPVRNIRVILAKDEYTTYNTDILTENFMIFISQFSTIRFMDLLSTNGSPVSEWSQTTRADQDTQAQPTGISMDLLSKIIRRTGRNVWINVPHAASDNYIQSLAQYLKDNIASGRTIYVEYSNQVWNGFFAQGKYAAAQALSYNLTNSHKFYAKRSLQIFNKFSSVFGTNNQLKFVVSFQAVSKWVADQILNGTGLQGVAHIIAGGAYYDCNSIGNTTNTALYATLTPADVIAKCNDNSSWATLDTIMGIQNNVSQTYKLPMAAYESGTSISETQTIYNGNQNPAATANFIAANRADGMYDVYKALLNRYKANNYTLNAPLMLFSSVGLPSKYGSWGLLDYMDQVAETPTHPKFRAVVDFNLGI